MRGGIRRERALGREQRLARCVLLLSLLQLAALTPLVASRSTGRVTTADGEPIEHARIEVEGAAAVFSGRDGRFELPELVLPAELVVTHHRFERQQATVSESSGPLAIVMIPKREVFETIAVSADRRSGGWAPVSVAADLLRPAEAVAPASVTELLSGSAAVAENGQGGLFQTFSVRGVARQRVLTLLAGMRIVGERRAGVSASFIDPLLLDKVEVVRGPASSYYGSGALGGIVQLFPRRVERTTVEVGATSEGSGTRALAAGATEDASWGLAWRRAGRAKAASGETLNSGFEQVSGVLSRAWRRGDTEIDIDLVASTGWDIGKSNSDFPLRRTDYPREEHLVARLAVDRAAKWRLDLAVHPNRLETSVAEDDGRSSRLDNRAFDLAASWQRRVRIGGESSARIGVDYFGRHGVTARERSFAAGVEGPAVETLDDAREDELGLFAAWERGVGAALLSLGGRAVWQRQANSGASSSEDTAMTAFAGLVVPVRQGLEVVGNVGTGLRFPSLSERFFSGTTGRGESVGNLALAPERAVSIDAGLRAWGERWLVTGFLFRNEIDDYIERVEIEPDVLTFVNLQAGKIEGVEVEGLFELSDRLTLELVGHALNGSARGGEPLTDIPGDRVAVGLRAADGRWRWHARWEHRSREGDPGSGERQVPAADLLSARVELVLGRGLTLEVGGRNLLDELYFASADRKAAAAPRRALSVGMRWSPPGAGSALP